ncbi:MAG: hypothetical protein U0T81_01320 [Saprospiraceae bacterium]
MDFATLFTEFNPHFFLGGDNVKFWGPLAWTIIFGLIVATFLTLLVVPCMYIFGHNTRSWIGHKFNLYKMSLKQSRILLSLSIIGICGILYFY